MRTLKLKKVFFLLITCAFLVNQMVIYSNPTRSLHKSKAHKIEANKNMDAQKELSEISNLLIKHFSKKLADSIMELKNQITSETNILKEYYTHPEFLTHLFLTVICAYADLDTLALIQNIGDKELLNKLIYSIIKATLKTANKMIFKNAKNEIGETLKGLSLRLEIYNKDNSEEKSILFDQQVANLANLNNFLSSQNNNFQETKISTFLSKLKNVWQEKIEAKYAPISANSKAKPSKKAQTEAENLVNAINFEGWGLDKGINMIIKKGIEIYLDYKDPKSLNFFAKMLLANPATPSMITSLITNTFTKQLAKQLSNNFNSKEKNQLKNFFNSNFYQGLFQHRDYYYPNKTVAQRIVEKTLKELRIYTENVLKKL